VLRFFKSHNLLLAAVLGVVMSSQAFCRERETIFQFSTLGSLMAGVYDGGITLKDLSRHGDIGLGTFDKLDGEMVVLDGAIYQVRSDATVHKLPGASLSPFACVTYFDKDVSMVSNTNMDMAALTRLIDSRISSVNYFYAIRITGTFAYVKTRSVPAQVKPYRKLTDVVANQPTFEKRDIKGTIVGFRCPPYVQGVNVPGYHLHFISEDKSWGGHILGMQTGDISIALDKTPGFAMELPKGGDFQTTDPGTSDSEAVKKVEK
jgi:acetolactate decarboxylase